ncbi:putative chloramphenicol acetyltransferase-like domain superfamily [Helianthus anomalus]
MYIYKIKNNKIFLSIVSVMMIGKFLLFGRRQLHTIISREIIKPSSSTPSHLQIYNLSPID